MLALLQNPAIVEGVVVATHGYTLQTNRMAVVQFATACSTHLHAVERATILLLAALNNSSVFPVRTSNAGAADNNFLGKVIVPEGLGIVFSFHNIADIIINSCCTFE